MRDGTLHLLSIGLPAGLLIGSFLASPGLFTVTRLAGDIAALPAAPVPLYRRGGSVFHYTSTDLLHPVDAGRPVYGAVLFDVWPMNEGHASSLDSLTWIRQIHCALSLRADADCPRSAIAVAATADSRAFERALSGVPRLERGAIVDFELPADSEYRKRTGVRHLMALAVKDPGERDARGAARGIDPLFAQALAAAAKTAAAKGETGIGIPLMMIPPRIGQPVSRNQAWRTILELGDRTARESGVRTVVYGGFGLEPESRAKTDEAFRQAWKSWREKLDAEAGHPIHEPLRLSALLSIAALASAAVRREPFTARRLVALLIVSAGVAATILGLFAWLQPLMAGALAPGIVLGLKAALAVAAGIFIEHVIRFKPQDELAARRTS